MNFAAFLRWIVGHIDELPRLIALAKAVFNAPDLPSRVEALVELIQALIPLLGDFPLGEAAVAALTTDEQKALTVQVEAKGIDIGDLVDLFRLIAPILLK